MSTPTTATSESPAAAASSASSSSAKMPTFPIGRAGKRELGNLLRKTTNPYATITSFQQSHSLHVMLSKAFGTTPKTTGESNATETRDNDNNNNTEPLDTDSVLVFLSKLGISQHEVNKRIADALRLQLEDEIRKQTTTEGLLNLLRSCWSYTTTIPELRPILWALLKQLGERTPRPVLERLAERDKDGVLLRFADVWHPLPPLLKRLVWEADWDNHVSNDEKDPKKYLQSLQETLFFEQLKPLMESYTQHPVLVEASNRPFVASMRERRLLTTQRRAISSATTMTITSASKSDLSAAAKAAAELKQLLTDGDTPAYRPKLLYATLSILMAYHGNCEAKKLLGGPSHLYCTLLADLLLSGPLPKAYQPVLALARTLDEAVKAGVLDDAHLAQVQSCLRQVYPMEIGAAEDEKESTATTAVASSTMTSQETKRLLKKIISAGLKALKEVDQRSLFLNPVTDAIAPGYSNVISKPMCIKQMEVSCQKGVYKTLADWDKDVQLMYNNCITYNMGDAGQWFRAEARRQKTEFSNKILPQAKQLYQTEVNKRNPPAVVADSKKRDASSTTSTVEPLAGGVISSKKRKKEAAATTGDALLPSMPALASMLLSDPFVVRLLLDRVLRCLRVDTWKGGSTIPMAHRSIPSLLQLLQMAELSVPICGARGREYIVPAAGTAKPSEDDHVTGLVPYQSLRQYTPLVLKLFLESELDKRMASDLVTAAQSLPARTTIAKEAWEGTSHLTVLRSMVEGALVYTCQPGNSYESSLAATFPKFSVALHELGLGTAGDEGPFFQSLLTAILNHKSKLQKANRDAIVKSWLEWVEKAGMTSAAHKYLVMLLAEWSTMGNLVLSRDLLVQFSQSAVKAAEKSETCAERKFFSMWTKDDFGHIREQYERILKALPDRYTKRWKEEMGILEEDKRAEEEDKMEVDGKAKGGT